MQVPTTLSVLVLVANQLADGMDRIMQLAKARDDNRDSGPVKTIENADTFAYYAIAAYVAD